jgi:hypothetical protein
MFWFISPWIAARLSLEAQRDMAFNFLRLASGQPRRRLASGQPRRQEVPSDGGPAPRLVDQRAVASVEPAIPARSMATGRPKAVPARKAMRVVSKPISASKVKDKRSTRKGKSRRKIGRPSAARPLKDDHLRGRPAAPRDGATSAIR